jgi:rubrerythrin
MPEFSTPFAGLAGDRKLTKEELIRAIRYSIAAEYEAIQLYMQLSESTDDARAAEVLKDVADEERVHAGEFLRLLRELAPDEQRLYAEGAEEVEEMFRGKPAENGKEAFREKGTETHVGMPYCTLAADAEHSRGYIEEEPCDDAGPGRHETDLYK